MKFGSRAKKGSSLLNRRGEGGGTAFRGQGRKEYVHKSPF